MGLVVVGGGVTGLAAGIATGAVVLEADSGPGGLSRSYRAEGYRFERGGGHWIFGGDAEVLALLHDCAPLTRHTRRSAVHFLDRDALVPFPVQQHLDALGADIASLVAAEAPRTTGGSMTQRDWLFEQFGPTLCELFFFPFHERYTAGLYREVAPQDGYKSPGVGAATRGYNTTFAYPSAGLDVMTGSLAARCSRVEYGARVANISTSAKTVTCDDGREFAYDQLVSTLPLSDTLHLAGVDLDEPADPYTSVLVVNIGARRGPKCPDVHWVYVPTSASGFHRVGFYSNVDESFLPIAVRGAGDRVAVYVERAFPGSDRPSPDDEARYVTAAVAELQELGYLGEVDVIDQTWIETAYTWRRPSSTWVHDACATLEQLGVRPIGRYGRWHFQGIADSVREGLDVESPVRAP